MDLRHNQITVGELLDDPGPGACSRKKPPLCSGTLWRGRPGR